MLSVTSWIVCELGELCGILDEAGVIDARGGTLCRLCCPMRTFQNFV